MKQHCMDCSTDFVFKTKNINIYCPNCGKALKNKYTKQCKLCGDDFVSISAQAMYCDKVPEDKTQPCFALAAREKYEQSLEKDATMMAYRKAYKKYNARVRIGKWSPVEFRHWANEAREKLSQCQSGKMAESEFKEWLKKGVKTQ